MNDRNSITSLRIRYDKKLLKKELLLALCMIAVFILAALSICVGAADLSFKDVWHAFFPGKELRLQQDYQNLHDIVWLLRLPRVLMAVLVGAGLALCGAVMQGITRNPLVSPYTVGISNASAFGVGLMVLFSDRLGLSAVMSNEALQMSGAFVMALLCAFLVYGVSALKKMNVTTLVLMGLALSYLFNALTNTMQYLANEQELSTIVRWTFGTLQRATWTQDGVLAVALIICFSTAMFNARNLNAMAGASEDVPKALGINVTLVRLVIGLVSVLLTALIVSFVGVIGFVGIVAPHIARMIIGSDNRLLIPFSCICGGMLLVISDTVGRTMFNPVTIPVGIVVAYVGVPIFVHLIIKGKDGNF